MAQDSCGREAAAEEGKAGGMPEEAGAAGEAQGAQVSFLTAALMGVALCFHSILEVRNARPPCMLRSACCERLLITRAQSSGEALLICSSSRALTGLGAMQAALQLRPLISACDDTQQTFIVHGVRMDGWWCMPAETLHHVLWAQTCEACCTCCRAWQWGHRRI